jgi:ABC-type transport system substrate-binding protein
VASSTNCQNRSRRGCRRAARRRCSAPGRELQAGDTEILPLKGSRLIIYPFNTTTKPFDDARVRQAVNYAVDRQAIISSLLEGYAEALHGPFAAPWLGYDPNLGPYPYDPARARQLLAEAGYPNGFETTFNFVEAAIAP